MRCSLLAGSIDKIDPCTTGIEVYLPTIILHLCNFNAPKSILCMENLAASQQIILIRSVMSQKRSLVTVTPMLRSGQDINEI